MVCYEKMNKPNSFLMIYATPTFPLYILFLIFSWRPNKPHLTIMNLDWKIGIIISYCIPSLMCAQRNKTKAKNKHSESWRSKDILLQLKEKRSLMYIYLHHTWPWFVPVSTSVTFSQHVVLHHLPSRCLLLIGVVDMFIKKFKSRIIWTEITE